MYYNIAYYLFFYNYMKCKIKTIKAIAKRFQKKKNNSIYSFMNGKKHNLTQKSKRFLLISRKKYKINKINFDRMKFYI